LRDNRALFAAESADSSRTKDDDEDENEAKFWTLLFNASGGVWRPSMCHMRQQRLLGQKKTKRIEQKVAKEAKGRTRRGVSGWVLFVTEKPGFGLADSKNAHVARAESDSKNGFIRVNSCAFAVKVAAIRPGPRWKQVGWYQSAERPQQIIFHKTKS
jgi:hypothetical protein